MTQDKLLLGYNSKILTNMYGMRVISDQCLRIIVTILLRPNMISTGMTQQAVVTSVILSLTYLIYSDSLVALDSISVEDFRRFQHWEQCWDCCIQLQGEYFKGD